MRGLKFIGTVFQVAGVMALSSRALEPWQAFSIMQVGSTIWLYIALRMRERELACINLMFMVSNTVGIWRWFHG